MSGEELSRALGDISDEKIQDALTVYERKRKIRSIWLRAISVAAVLAIILGMLLWSGDEDGFVTAPGVLKVYASDVFNGKEYVLVEGQGIHSSCLWGEGMNYAYGLPIRFEMGESEFVNCRITYDISVNFGFFYGDINLDKYRKENVSWRVTAFLDCCFTIDDGEVIYWNYDSSTVVDQNGIEDIFVDVVMKADDQIVGFAVLRVKSFNNGTLFAAEIIKSICFPKINGIFQDVNREYIDQEIFACR